MSIYAPDHQKELASFIARVEILDDETYLIDGNLKKVYQHEPYLKGGGDLATFGKHDKRSDDGSQKALLIHLTNTLYAHFHCGIKEGEELKVLPPMQERMEFMDRLSASNYSSNEPDPAWKWSHATKDGLAYATKNGLYKLLISGTYTFQSNGTITFFRQREFRNGQPVFYFVNSNEWFQEEKQLIRIYWNLKPDGAPILVEQISTLLNAYFIPFRFKCLNHQQLFTRNDSAVLYIYKTHLEIVTRLLPKIHHPLECFLKENLPPFTKKIYQKTAMAEDPGTGESYGMYNMAAMAKQIITDYQERNCLKQQSALPTQLSYQMSNDNKDHSNTN